MTDLHVLFVLIVHGIYRLLHLSQDKIAMAVVCLGLG